jgi:hypothetical protein
MEIQNKPTQLNDIESQITEEDKRILVKNENSINDVCCAKICIAISVSAILSPIAICDLYYATTDESCITQSQSNHHLTIILQSYLMASGIMTFIGIGIFNFSLFVLDVNMFSPNKSNDETEFGINIFSWIFRMFELSWIILGCVLFWAYTDIGSCSQTVHDYLFARFIIAIVSYVLKLTQKK